MTTENSEAPNTNDAIAPERTWPVTIELKHPFVFGKQHFTSLTFRRGRMGDLKGMGMRVDGIPPVDQLIMIASRMCGEVTAVLDRLDAEDSAEVLELAVSFFASCLSGTRMP
jgi:hypothetical protein